MFLYVIRIVGTTPPYYSVGVCTHPAQHLARLQRKTAVPLQFEMVAQCHVDDRHGLSIEATVHQILKAKGLETRGWFTGDADLSGFVEAGQLETWLAEHQAVIPLHTPKVVAQTMQCQIRTTKGKTCHLRSSTQCLTCFRWFCGPHRGRYSGEWHLCEPCARKAR